MLAVWRYQNSLKQSCSALDDYLLNNTIFLSGKLWPVAAPIRYIGRAAQAAEKVIGLVRLVVRCMAEQSHQICNSLLSGMTGNLEFGRVESVCVRRGE